MSLLAELPLHVSKHRLGLTHVVFVDRCGRRGRRPLDLCPAPFRSSHPLLDHEDPLPSTDHLAFVRWLFEQVGLDAGKYGQQTLRRRIQACLRALQVGSCSEARRVLEKSPSLMRSAISSLVIGVTSFFRDPAVFDCLRETILRRQDWWRGGLRIWSAACADGPELYSIAMMLAEVGLLHRAELLGTDCRADAIARARDGVYDAASVRHVYPAIIDRYFRPEADGNGGSDYRIVEPLRRATQWRTGNLLTQSEPGLWNIILCRNMAMYLKPEVAGALWRNLESMLCPGGLLVLGKAERPGGNKLSMIAPCVYRRDRG
jgi:chemotaxis protein methyltransferase CheR